MTMAFQLPVTIHTRTIKAPGVTIYEPNVAGLANRHAQQQINRTIDHTIQAMRKQQMQVFETGSSQREMLGHYEIKTNERGILSLILSNYAYSYPMAHGNTIARSLTFDVNTGKLYSLSDLFMPGSNYVKALSEQIAVQIKQRDLPLLDGFQAIKPDQDYYLADKALVVYFQLYEITPYYAGFPMFPISVYSVQSIAADPGPLTTLAADLA